MAEIERLAQIDERTEGRTDGYMGGLMDVLEMSPSCSIPKPGQRPLYG